MLQSDVCVKIMDKNWCLSRYFHFEQTMQVSSLPAIYFEHGSVPHWT